MINDIYGNSIHKWLNDDSRKNGMNKYNVEFFKKIRDLEYQFKVNNIILYFMTQDLNQTSMYPMLTSSSKQKRLLSEVLAQLKKYQVSDDKNTLKMFRTFITNISKRKDHVRLIIRENLYTTEYWVYFENGGFDKLEKFVPDFNDSSNQKENMKKEISEYLNLHPNEIKAHMEATEQRRINEKQYKENIIKRVKDGIEEDKKRKREEDEKVAEIRRNQRNYERRKKIIDRSFEKYYNNKEESD